MWTFSLPIIILSFAQYGKETENRKVGDIKCLKKEYWYIHWLQAITSKHPKLQKTTQMRNSPNDDIIQLDANNRKKKGKKSLKS